MRSSTNISPTLHRSSRFIPCHPKMLIRSLAGSAYCYPVNLHPFDLSKSTTSTLNSMSYSSTTLDTFPLPTTHKGMYAMKPHRKQVKSNQYLMITQSSPPPHHIPPGYDRSSKHGRITNPNPNPQTRHQTHIPPTTRPNCYTHT